MTGKHVVRIALEKGWEVVAAVRDPTKLQDLATMAGADRLKIEKANIFESSSLVPLMKGCDCVISGLGPSGYYNLLPWVYVDFYSESAKHITAAMKEAGVKRLLFVSSWCTVYKPGHPFVIEWLLKPLFLGRMLADLGRMEQFLSELPEEEVNFTAVKPPGLNDNPAVGNVLAVEGEFHPDGGYQIPRADVAAWMLDNINAEDWSRKLAAVGVAK